MKLGRCMKQGKALGICILEDNQLKRLDDLLGIHIENMIELIENWEDIKGEIHKKWDQTLSYDLEDVIFLSPMPHPRRNLICIGKNYLEHAKELEGKTANLSGIPKQPIFFSKMAYETIGDGQSVEIQSTVTQEVDYEVELAVVLGKKVKNMTPEEVEESIFGFTICNDITARDLQVKHIQWHLGKSQDTFTPIGPIIVTKDEFSYPPNLAISCKINGEVRQNSRTDHFIFDIDTLISTLSQGMTLIPGDIILTGTPAGVGMGFNPPRFLKAGDEIVCEIEGIGLLRNDVVTKN